MKKIISALLSLMIFVMYTGVAAAAPALGKSAKGVKIASSKSAPQAATVQQTDAAIKAKKQAVATQKAAQQQMQQMQQQQKQLESNNQQLQKQLQQLNQVKLNIERQKVDQDAKIRWYEAQTDRQYYASKAKNDTKRTAIEEEQLYDGNPYNDEIRNI